jgi:hypothetical protein
MLYPAELRGPRPDDTPPAAAMPPQRGTLVYRIVGITYSAPDRIPAGQRDVTVFSLV